MKKKNTEESYRRGASTYREYKHNMEYIRPKRKKQANSWYLERHNGRCGDKGWKNKRRHQYKNGGRGTKKEITTFDLDNGWDWIKNLEDHCEDYEISCKKEYFYESRYRTKGPMVGTQYRYIVGIKFTWWSNKDIGVDYLFDNLKDWGTNIIFE